MGLSALRCIFALAVAAFAAPAVVAQQSYQIGHLQTAEAYLLEPATDVDADGSALPRGPQDAAVQRAAFQVQANPAAAVIESPPAAEPLPAADAPAATQRPAAGEPAAASAATTPPAEKPGAAPLPDEASWAASMEVARAAASEIPGLSDEVRQQVIELYTQTIKRLNDATQFAAQTAALRDELARAGSDLDKLQQALASGADSTYTLPPNLSSLAIDELRAAYRACDTALNEQRNNLQGITLEIERRAARLKRAPEMLSQARTSLDDAAKQLAAPPNANEHAELVTARRVRWKAGRQAREREIEHLQQESKTYDETSRVWSLKRDAADRGVKATQRQLAQLQRALAEAEKVEAQQQAAEARRAAVNAHPAVRQAASVNSELADANSGLVAALEITRNELKSAEDQVEELSNQYADTRERAEAADFSPAIGLMLRSQQAELPDTHYYRQRAIRRDQEQALLNLKVLEWENERRKIVDTEAVVDKNLQSISSQLGLIEQVDVRVELEQVFTARLAMYAELINNARTQLRRLNLLGLAEEKLIKVVDEQATFISENILWVRSTSPLTPSLISPLSTAVGSIVDAQVWLGVWNDLKSDVKTHPIFELLLIPPFWLLVIRRRLWSRLAMCAQEAQRSSATGFTPTIRAVLSTAALAVPVPSLIALFGWRLTSVAAVGEFSHALGKSALIIAGALLIVEFIRYACQSGGLAETHFGWKQECLDSLRRAMALVKLSCLPASFVCLFAEFSGDELIVSTVGRLALIIESMAVATIAFELLKPSGPIAQVILSGHERSWSRHTYRLWATVLVVVPVVLALASSIGFHYTATRLSMRMTATWGVIALLVAARALAMRWLLVVYRRFAINRAREKRALLQARQVGTSDSGDVPIAGDTSLDLRLSEINGQAQNLIHIIAAVVGGLLLTFIWHELLPAFSGLIRYELWENGVLPPSADGHLHQVTLVDLLLGGAWMTLTILACRNLPGLLDITVLQRLPLDPGARYAASALTQYTLVVIGTAICFRQIGIGWQSVQWLIAAMTVGLGFGLQEIFANFVSGIILLFERPIRVGDTVTIGTVSGTVTRIRIRATTVLDWDNKELIVPNRDFVTGNLVNWTLTNPNLRVVINIGIAYGSDTRLATKLLMDIASAHPLALKDPEPVVVFTRFAESSLEFELRVFSLLGNSRDLRHELHLAIDDAFREHNINIAFPTQDLHVRSLPQSMLEQLVGVAEPAEDLTAGREKRSKKHVA